MQIESIGTIRKTDQGSHILIHERFRPALLHTGDFSHLQVVCWAHLTDKPELREKRILEKLFRKGPEKTGVFSTRSPVRPNPVMISTIRVLAVDEKKGLIRTPFIDVEDGTPVLDIKPYFPMERVRDCQAPDWCSHWPAWQEDAPDFDWAEEINFK